jgi:transcriptional regulator with GAF, ATPase, and Fis domain
LKAEIGRLNEALDRDRSLLREITDSAGLHAAATPPEPAPIGGPSTLEDVERAHILATLTQTGWVIEGPRGAARILDLHPNTLRSRMKKLGLERARHGLPPVEGV